jgi:hypothetical protein
LQIKDVPVAGRKALGIAKSKASNVISPERLDLTLAFYSRNFLYCSIFDSQPSKTASISISKGLRTVPNASETMLDRWRNSPPEEEPANLTAINNAITASESPLLGGAFSVSRIPQPTPTSNGVEVPKLYKSAETAVVFYNIPCSDMESRDLLPPVHPYLQLIS